MGRRRGLTRRRGKAKIELDYDGIGDMLNSPEMHEALRSTAENVAADIGGNVEVREPINPSRHNRARYYVTYDYENPRDRNETVSRVFSYRNRRGDQE